MEIGVSAAKARLSELVAAARRGERVVITKYGKPMVELVACARSGGGIDFEKLEATRRRLGIEDATPEEREAMHAALHDSALSHRVLGLDPEE